jgi:conjugal transfer pilus assembly protein TraE
MNESESLVGKSYRDFEQSKKFNRTVISALSIACAVLTIMVASKDTEIVVMPPSYDSELRVHGNQANEQYMLRHAMGIASLVGNVNERNIDFVVSTVEKMLSPFLQSNLEEGLRNEAQILKIRKASQTFVIEDMMYEPKNNLVWVWGTKTLKVHTGTEKKERFTYEFRIEANNGVPRITHYDAYAGIPKQKNNEEYTVDTSPFLTDALEKAKTGTDPDKAKFKVIKGNAAEPESGKNDEPSTDKGTEE